MGPERRRAFRRSEAARRLGFALGAISVCLAPACGKNALTSTEPGAVALKLDAPQSTAAGATFDITVKVLNASGAPAADFSGAVSFTSSDSNALLPAPYIFISSDMGRHVFLAIFVMPGMQTITATSGQLTSSASILVTAGADAGSADAGDDAGSSDAGAADAGADDAGTMDGGAGDAGTGTLSFGGSDWILHVGCSTCTLSGVKILAQPDGSLIAFGNVDSNVFAPDDPLFDVGDPAPLTFMPPSIRSEIWLARWGAGGEIEWVKRAGGADDDAANDAEPLPDGTLLATGFVTLYNDPAEPPVFGAGEANQTVAPIGLGRVLFLARYNLDGTLASVKFNGDPDGGGASSGSALAIHGDGSFTVCAQVQGTAIFGPGEPAQTTVMTDGGALVLAHYNADQTLAWTKLASSSEGTSLGGASSCIAAADGGIFLGGAFSGAATFGSSAIQSVSGDGADALLARFDSDGGPVWAQLYEAAPGAAGSSAVSSISMTPSGDVIVAGSFTQQGIVVGSTTLGGVGRNSFLARVGGEGTVAWAKAVSGDTNQGEGVVIGSVALGPSDAFYAAGYFSGSATFGAGEPNATVLYAESELAAFVAVFDAADGTLQFARLFTTPSTSCYPSPASVATRGDGSLGVLGELGGTCTFGPAETSSVRLAAVGFPDLFLADWLPH